MGRQQLAPRLGLEDHPDLSHQLLLWWRSLGEGAPARRETRQSGVNGQPPSKTDRADQVSVAGSAGTVIGAPPGAARDVRALLCRDPGGGSRSRVLHSPVPFSSVQTTTRRWS